MLYFDSNYLFRLYSTEVGYEEVQALADKSDGVAITSWARAEFASRLVFTNCDEIACVAEDRLGAIFVRGSDLDRLAPEDFQIIEAWLAERPATAKRKDPKPHPFPLSLTPFLFQSLVNWPWG
jgi:hypothetical protein